MSESKLAFESDLEGWVGFKHLEKRGREFQAEERKKSFYGLHGFIAIYMHVWYKIFWKLQSQFMYGSWVQEPNRYFNNSFVKRIQTLFLLVMLLVFLMCYLCFNSCFSILKYIIL